MGWLEVLRVEKWGQKCPSNFMARHVLIHMEGRRGERRGTEGCKGKEEVAGECD